MPRADAGARTSDPRPGPESNSSTQQTSKPSAGRPRSRGESRAARLPTPTRHKPGTEAKVRGMERRRALGQQLFHPDDAQLDLRDCFAAEMAGGDNAFALALLRQNELGQLETVEVKPQRKRRHRTEQEKLQAFLNREREKLRKR